MDMNGFEYRLKINARCPETADLVMCFSSHLQTGTIPPCFTPMSYSPVSHRFVRQAHLRPYPPLPPQHENTGAEIIFFLGQRGSER